MKRLLKNLARILNYLEIILESKRAKRRSERNVYDVLWERAVQQSADFIEEHLDEAVLFRSSENMWDYVISELQTFSSGTVLEFGVASGHSINYLSSKLGRLNFYGFDSFEGLPESWYGHHALRGGYTQNGIQPDVNNNVKLIKGWFDQTLPGFTSERPWTVLRLIHIDSDLYSAATIVLESLIEHVEPGCYILFDEYHGYPNWKNGEFKAFQEIVNKYQVNFKYEAFSKDQCLIKIIR